MQRLQDNGPPSRLVTIFSGKYRARLRLFLIVAALMVTLDQLSKLWINANRPQIGLLPGFLDLVYVENRGAIFGLFHSHAELFIALGIVASVVILVFLYYFPPATNVGTVSFALILSGAVGNLIDRIRFGYVIDFIGIHVQELFHWPAFNVADAALTVGIFMLIYYFYKWGVSRRAHEHGLKPRN
jgi:signal peptidase II